MTVSADPSGDTIVAIATPPGTGALAIVRLSGPAAVAVADGAFRGRRPLREAATHTAHYGRIVQSAALFRPGGDEAAHDGAARGCGRPETTTGDGQPEPSLVHVSGPMCTTGPEAPAAAVGTTPEPAATGGLEVVDDVIATVFRAPASYTGEDTVEITCHGSNLVAATVVAALLGHGARAAEPGEFTRRAFLNGKLDLTQAEAVAEVIQSATAAALRGARNRLNGALGTQVSGLRQQLLECAARVELELDFAEEDVELAPAEETAARVAEVRSAIAAMLATFRTGRMLRDGVHVVLAGPPNVGKSSLLNRLAQESRALVTDIPGTTRDVIREDLDIHGVPVRLHDTAGLRVTDETVERLGVERSLATVADADLVLFVTAADEPFPHPALEQVRGAVANAIATTTAAAPGTPDVVVIANKCDLTPAANGTSAPRPALTVSAKTGKGIDALSRLLVAQTVGQADSGYTERSSLVASARHRDNLQRADTALARAHDAATAGAGGELVAADLRAAVAHLEEIIGIVASDDVLNRIFAHFCIGK